MRWRIASRFFFLRACFAGQVRPLFLCYDAACKLVQGLQQRCPGLLDNEGILLRDAEGNVSFPELAHVGNNRESAARTTVPCSPPEEPRRTTDTEDMYAVMEASGPQPGVQSEVDPHEALYWAAYYSKQVGEPCRRAATRALDALWREGVQILSLYEVLVFLYHWHRVSSISEPEGPPGGLAVGIDGWVVREPSLSADLVGDEGVGTVTHKDAMAFFQPALVGLSGSRQASKMPSLPSWLDKKWTSEACAFEGLQGYAQVRVFGSGDCFCRRLNFGRRSVLSAPTMHIKDIVRVDRPYRGRKRLLNIRAW